MRRAVRPRPAHGRSRPLLWIVSAGIALAVLSLNLRRKPPGTALRETPQELQGRWTTEAPRYEGRALHVTADSVILETGPGLPPRRGRIRSVRTWKEGLVPVVRVEYDAGNGPETMDILMVGDDSMRLRNPRDVLWTKVSGP